MWQLNAVSDPRLGPVLENWGSRCRGAIKVIIGSTDKIEISIVDYCIDVKFATGSNCNCYITMAL